MNKAQNNILITGAGKGIGLALAKEVLVRGHRVTALSRNTEKLAQLEGEIRVVQMDISKFENYPGEMVKLVPAGSGPFDIVVHNAGLLINKPFAEISHEDLTQAYNVNVFAPFLLTQALLAHCKNAHHIYIGSMGGYQGSVKFPGLSAYSTAKAAVACLAEMLAEEHKGRGHTFNCLCLGAVQTEMLEAAFPGYTAPVIPEDMAKFIADFAFQAPGVLNGKVIPVSLSNP